MAYYSKFGGADIEKWVGEVPSLKSRLDACETDVSQAIYDSSEASVYAQRSYGKSIEAVNTASIAKNAVATLEGLSTTTTAQQTLAATVTKIEQNTVDVNSLKSMFVYMTEAEYEALEVKDPDKLYMLYEE